MIGIIGGTGFYDAIKGREVTKETGYGHVTIIEGKLDDIDLVFANRHTVEGRHKILPHEVNYRAIIKMMKLYDVDRLFSIGAVGGIASYMKVGDIYTPMDVIDFTSGRQASFFGQESEEVAHLISENLFCPDMRKALLDEIVTEREEPRQRYPHVYVCTNGPRLETPAEIRHFRSIGGTLVGMTLMPEAALAAELGVCYLPINIVVNPAAGVSPGFQIKLDEIKKAIMGAQDKITRAIINVSKKLAAERICGCDKRLIYM
jgi:5'-methylthioadenosine phosphorylase